MTEKIKVRAVEGRSMPHEHDVRKYVTGTEMVPNTLHYRRAIARGDIELVTDDAPSKGGKQKAEG
jgi:hypothetical protein